MVVLVVECLKVVGYATQEVVEVGAVIVVDDGRSEDIGSVVRGKVVVEIVNVGRSVRSRGIVYDRRWR